MYADELPIQKNKVEKNKSVSYVNITTLHTREMKQKKNYFRLNHVRTVSLVSSYLQCTSRDSALKLYSECHIISPIITTLICGEFKIFTKQMYSCHIYVCVTYNILIIILKACSTFVCSKIQKPSWKVSTFNPK